jgi:CRP/FNR family transcriptional regulator
MPLIRHAHSLSPPTDLLAEVRFLRGLAPEILDALAACAIPIHYDAGTLIFLEGEPAANLYLVERGIVKISRISQEGREHILVLIRPGETFNDVAVMDGGPNPATATAQTDVDLWIIDRERFRVIARRYPDLSWALIADLAGRTRYMIGVVQDLAMRTVRGRLAHLLLEEAGGTQGDEVPRLLTQEEMAARLGTVRDVVGRTLRNMAADGIITFDRHRIVILDAERLQAEAEV